MKNQKQNYSLFTAIAMIVGIVIGSGIFFKADNMLVSTDGNVGKAVIIFCVAAFSIVFGSLSFSLLASLTDKPGGLITYADEFVNKRFACALGWFQMYIYFPTLTVVLSWVSGIYLGIVFGWDLDLKGQILVGFLWFLICFGYNLLSAKIGGKVQEIATVVKLIPLFAIGAAGMFLGHPLEALTNPTPELVTAGTSLAWISAIGPVAFSFDGWIVSTAVAHEVKNSKRNVPRALVVAPLFILAAYLLYFLGICGYIGPEKVMELGDESVSLLATEIFGTGFASAIMVFVAISIMGTTNGLILGYMRVPYSLGLRNMIPGSKYVQKLDVKTNMPVNSAIYCIGICLVWWVIHYFTMSTGFLPNSDISEIAIVISYILYVVLYYQCFKLWKARRVEHFRNGVLYPVLATLGSLFILVGGLQNPNFFLFVAVSLLAVFGGVWYGKNARHIN